MPQQASLTTHLLSLDEPHLKRATTHPFLTAAATSSLPPAALKHWLGQDRIYALSYVSFIGKLLAQIPIPTHADRASSLEWRLVEFLIDALTNIREEIALFEDTARDEGWLGEICGVEVGGPARRYGELFDDAAAAAAGSGGRVGIVVLWATEECYLRSWRFARERMGDGDGDGNGNGEGDVMRRVFVPNWSSEGFGRFVARLGEFVDEIGSDLEVGGSVWRECEGFWKRALQVEEDFWPAVDAGF